MPNKRYLTIKLLRLILFSCLIKNDFRNTAFENLIKCEIYRILKNINHNETSI